VCNGAFAAAAVLAILVMFIIPVIVIAVQATAQAGCLNHGECHRQKSSDSVIRARYFQLTAFVFLPLINIHSVVHLPYMWNSMSAV